MQRKFIIKKTNEIDAVFNQKKYRSNKYLSIHYQNKNELNEFRFMISIGRKYGNAVFRNKAKRRIREVLRILKNDISNQIEFCIVVKPLFVELSFEQIKENIYFLLTKAKILKEK